MSPSPRHLLTAGALLVCSAAVPVAAWTAAPPAPSGRPALGATVSAGPTAKAPSVATPDLSAVARSAGLSTRRLYTGLAAAKRAGGNDAAGVSAFVTATAVSRATAVRVLDRVFGARSHDALDGPAATAALSSRLGVSRQAAHAALARLSALSRARGGVDPASAAFRSVARGLGVTPRQLAGALDDVKKAAARP